MSSRRLIFFSVLILGLVSLALMQTTVQDQEEGLIADRNVNVVGGVDFEGNPNDPYLQRQNEPTLAFSTRNVMNVLACFNDYRTVDMDFPAETLPGTELGATPDPDAWLGYSQSNNGGGSWKTFLLPGYPQDISPEGLASPLHYVDENTGYITAADPVVRAGTNGLFYMAGIAFNRDRKNANPVFVARFIDKNNKEFESAIEYVDTQVWNTADNDMFFDKPWLEVDGPHGVGQRVTIAGESVPKSNVYLAYAAFRGAEVATKGFTSIQQEGLTSQIYFQRSTDCGETWEPPVVFDSGHDINQGASLAVDPRNNGQVICTWRTFDGPYEAIMAAISTNNGVDWDRVVEVAAFPPFPNGAFDQPTEETKFRTNAYPSAAIDENGYIYIVWTQKGIGLWGESRLLIATSTDGLNWSAPMRVDSPQDQEMLGNQFQPSITIAAGKMLIAYVDQRFDVVGINHPETFSEYFIDEHYPVRHTLDIRVAQATPSLTPIFSKSIQASRYLWAYTGGQAIQLEYHTPGDKIFANHSVPFIGDYLDIAPSPRFLPAGNGWVFNKDPNPTTTFQVAWTDNRDVLGDLLGTYHPPGEGCDDELFETGIRNQNVYTARISEGIIAGSPGNTKPLNIKRAFVVQAKNTTSADKIVRFEVDANTGPYARFWEAGIEYDYLERTIPAYSSFATTVLVDPYGDEYAPVYINILEGGTIVSQIVLNPDPTNPEILDPYNENPLENPHIVNDEVHTPHIVNWTYEEVNPHIVNYDLTNPHIVNTDMVTPHIVNDDPLNPHIVNTDIVNPHIVNTSIGDVEDGSTGTDTIYTVQNDGNTTSSYSLGTYPADVPNGLLVQILVYKIYTTPTSMGCQLNQSEHQELIVNHTNPHIVNKTPGVTTQGIGSMLQENEDVWDVHFHLQPGEQAYIVYRTYNPDPDNIIFTDPLVPKITSDIANVWDGNLDQMPAYPLLVVTTSVNAGIAGEEFAATVEAFGGAEPYEWTLDGPGWMDIDPLTGIISGTPPTAGTYDFSVTVTDSGDPQQVRVQNFSIYIVTKLDITTTVLNDGVIDQPYPGTQIEATGGTGNYVWSLDFAPDWMTIDPSTGMISSSTNPDSVDTFPVTVKVTDMGPPYQEATSVDLSVDIGEPLQILTTELPPGIAGYSYSAEVSATGGVGSYHWELEGAPAEMTIDPITGITEWSSPVFGTYIFTVLVHDDFTPTPLEAAKQFTVEIHDPLLILTDSANLAPAYVGTPYGAFDEYTDTLGAEGGFLPYTWGLTEESEPLPSGLTLSQDGVISGEPLYDPNVTYPIEYTFEVYVEDPIGLQRDTRELTITVNPKIASSVMKPTAAGETEANAIATDDDGNIYVVGKIIPDGDDSDLYIAKYDSSGDLQWENTEIGGLGDDEAEAVAVASAGNETGIFITGYITNANGDTDIFLTKLDNSGEVVEGEEWPIIIDGGYGNDQASAIALKGDIVCITGFSTGKTSGEDYYTAVYSTSGEYKWHATYDGPAHQGDFAKAVAISDSGNVSITGASFRGNKQNGHLDYQTMTFDSLGELIWEARYDGKENGDDEALAIVVDLADHVYVTGRSELSKKKIKDFDYYTIKYDAAGDVVWDVRYDSGFGDDEAAAMALDETGLYVTGFDTGEFSGANYYTVKYDLADGHVLGEAWYDADNGDDRATGMALDSTGVHVTGWSKSGLPGSDFDIYTVKYTTTLESVLWETRYDGGEGIDDYAVAIVKSITGEVYVTGISQTDLLTTMVTLKY